MLFSISGFPEILGLVKPYFSQLVSVEIRHIYNSFCEIQHRRATNNIAQLSENRPRKNVCLLLVIIINIIC
jgi:hypothetical protein